MVPGLPEGFLAEEVWAWALEPGCLVPICWQAM